MLRKMLKLTLIRHTIKIMNPKMSHSSRLTGKMSFFSMRDGLPVALGSILETDCEFCKEQGRGFPNSESENPLFN